MAIDTSRIKAICFDVDGTLSDTDDEWVSQLEHRLRLFGSGARPLARWLVMASETPMNAVYHWLDALSLDDNFARMYERAIQKRKGAPQKFWLMAGARNLLEILSQRFPLAVVSARDEMTTHAFLRQFELEGYFKTVATSQTCERTKPSPAPLIWAAQQMGVAPQNCLMVGDTTVDILAGRAAGAQTIGLLCGFGTQRELARAGADMILQHLKELHKLLE